jgi:hypothetical protein
MKIFQLGKAAIHAGALEARKLEKWDLVINLTGYSTMAPEVRAYNGAAEVCREFLSWMPKPSGYRELTIDWPDGKVPGMKRKDWRRLVADLQQFDGKILVHCHGGHGRTGTLLVILAGLGNALPDGVDPVKYIRNLYCSKIVESWSQIDYLTKNMQIKTEATPRFYHAVQWTPVPQTQSYKPHTPEEQIGTWWDKENTVTKDLPIPLQRWKCVLCQIHKCRELMFSCFTDGTGYCYLCDETTRAYGQER